MSEKSEVFEIIDDRIEAVKRKIEYFEQFGNKSNQQELIKHAINLSWNEIERRYSHGTTRKTRQSQRIHFRLRKSRFVGGVEMRDEFMVRYTNKHGFGCTLVVYATTMFEAKEKAEKELGDYLKSINEIVNCSFARELIRSQDVE